jgi:hypothetical protein
MCQDPYDNQTCMVVYLAVLLLVGNAAYRKTVTVSSADSEMTRDRLVDGDKDSTISCFQFVQNTGPAWWMVDLGAVHEIQFVSLFGRQDMVENNGIFISNSTGGGWLECMPDPGCGKARYLKQVADDPKSLYLCEIVIYGFVALGMLKTSR